MKSSQTVQPNTSEGISPIQPFGCARCLGVLFETSQELITHFRLKHGIKPETFSAEKRKRFYDSFNQPDTENATKPAVRSSSLLVPAEQNGVGETSVLKKNDSRKRHKISPEQLSVKKRKTSQDTFQFETQTPKVGDKVPEDISEETGVTMSDDDTSYSSSDQSSDSSQSSSTADSDQFSSKPTRQASSASTVPPNPLSGTLYRCPHCSRCMGYAILQLQRHHRRYAGSCVSCKTKDDHFICSHCKTDYTTEFTLTNHTKRFNGNCKQYQITQSNNYLGRQTEGDALLKLEKEDIEPLEIFEPIMEAHPFKHQGHLIPVVDNCYKCPWCLRLFGNKPGVIRRHLATPSGICQRKKVADEPQCVVCMMHFSTKRSLVRHVQHFGGTCTRQNRLKDQNRVDITELVKRSKKKSVSSDKKDKHDLFFCKHCNRCMGCSYRNLRNHLFVTQGRCKPTPLKNVYVCEDCNFEFTSPSSLKRHTTRFAGRCIEADT